MKGETNATLTLNKFSTRDDVSYTGVNPLIMKHGLQASRLKSFGVASLSPVASNDTEEGRAKNRRVELVKQ